MTKIESLANVSFDEIFVAFSEAFVDYEMQLKKEELQNMLLRRGFVPELSFAAFEENKIVSFTLNGLAMFNGVKTAYDTGTGTLKDFRGKGLASKIFSHSVPLLRKAGVSQYLLEVLQHNTKAVSIYRNMEFVVSREFNYFMKKKDEVKLLNKTMNPEFTIENIDLDICKTMLKFCDFEPSWQNSFESISRSINDFKILGVFHEQEIIAYCIFEPLSGDITQIAVNKNFRRKGIATNLLKHVFESIQNNNVKVINTDVDCKSINEFLKANSFQPIGKQFEMINCL
jgi:ribosomal protein S18 acetylase RimI-like enzyme